VNIQKFNIFPLYIFNIKNCRLGKRAVVVTVISSVYFYIGLMLILIYIMKLILTASDTERWLLPLTNKSPSRY